MADQFRVAVVGDHADPLSSVVAATLQAKGLPVLHVAPGTLADLPLHLQGDTFRVAGDPLGGILFRSSPEATFSLGFAPQDQSFCDAEVKATWLAALHLDSLLAVNRYDAAAWFEGAGWPVWRQRLVEAGIAVSPFLFGDVQAEDSWSWVPYTSVRVRLAPDSATRRVMGSALTQSVRHGASLVVCRQVVAGKAHPNVLDTADLLHDAGVHIAEIATDPAGRVLSVDTLPKISDVGSVERAAQLLVERYHGHLHRG